MSGVRGADLDSLEAFGTNLERRSGELRTLTSAATAAAMGLTAVWQGPDSGQFRQLWSGSHRPRLLAAVGQLQGAASTIERNRAAQEAASAANGSSSATGDFTNLDDPELAGDKVDRRFWFDGFEHDDYTFERLDDATHGLFGPEGSEQSPQLTDIDQGGLGDCWFLAGLGAVAHNDPSFIENQITDNGDGTYTVTLYEPDGDGYKPVEITVDDEFPVNADGAPMYSRPSGDGATWAMIYEKAFAEHSGGYDDIEGGSAQNSLAIITGSSIERENPNNLTDTELVTSLQDSPAAIGMVNPDTNPETNSADDVAMIETFNDLDLAHSHQYVVEDVFETDGQWFVQLYNPHGVAGMQPGPITLDEFRTVSDELNTPA